MFVEDLRNDFYNLLLGNRVLLLVHYDVDAICTCKILQNLFKCDNISYTLVPVGGISELKTAYEENNDEIKYVVLVNCGGTIDLVDILQPEEEVVFFVLDSHKPTDVCNVYSDGQVRLVYRDSEENIPNFDDIFRDENEDEEESEGRGLEALEAAAERRRERRAWEERRDQLMFTYTQFSYRGKPSAFVALELSWMLSRCGVNEQWAAGVGGASLEIVGARSPSAALLDAELLHRLLARGAAPDTEARVVLEKDLCLPLYRRWSLEEALRHSPTLGPHLRAPHSIKRLLAQCGFPLSQARGAWASMDVSLRHGATASLEAACTQLGLPPPTKAAFLLRRPLAPDVPAADLVFIVQALIEHETIPRGEGFQLSLSALECSLGDNNARRVGSEAAQRALTAVSRCVSAALAGRVRRAGPFDYFTLQEGTPEALVLNGPLWLGAAARFASACLGGSRPVLASAPLEPRRCLLLGAPPKAHHHNLLGAAFEQAAAKSGVTISLEHVDPGVVTLEAARRQQLLDALTALLA